MTEQEMWEAVCNSDENYDGIFFYAVKTTGIFCRPSCKSKLPKKENICYFASAQAAKKAGFRPCKRCRSDLIKYQPMKKIAKDLKCKIDEIAVVNSDVLLNDYTLIQKNMTDIYKQEYGLTQRRMTDIFKKEYGMTPKKYADILRIELVKNLLKDTNKKIIDIAYEAGFSNLSAFNRFFKNKTGKTPTEYRKIVIC